MAGHSDCLGVLRQLVRMLSQSDDTCGFFAEAVRKEGFGGKTGFICLFMRVFEYANVREPEVEA